MNHINNTASDFKTVFDRCLKYKPIIENNEFMNVDHIKKAEEAAANCNYFKAISEYRNYITLVPSEKDKYLEHIKKIESFLHPEKAVIQSCLKQGQTLIDENKHFEAREYFTRVLLLAEQGTSEHTIAKGRLSSCLLH